jgi:hypothetical protein
MSGPDDANHPEQVAGGAQDRPQDPHVQRLRPDPSQAGTPPRVLRGLWGDSDRPGYRRLYFSRLLDWYAEFRLQDVVAVEDVPPEKPPFLGERASRVALRPDAPVDITRSRAASAVDAFDLDVRFGYPIVSAELPNNSVLEPCLLCATPGEVTCDTSQTCDTCFGQVTCAVSCVECVTDLCVSQAEPC